MNERDPLDGYRPQKPYKNGITVYRGSYWGGNGFGNTVRLKAVHDGRVVGEYESGLTYVKSTLEGHGEGEFAPDLAWHPSGGSYTTRTRYLKWLTAVKAWRPSVEPTLERGR